MLSYALLATLGPQTSAYVTVAIDGVASGNVNLRAPNIAANATVWTSPRLDPSVTHSIRVRSYNGYL